VNPTGYLFPYPGEEYGDQVALAGTARLVTEFTFYLASTNTGYVATDLRARLYANDGPGVTPGTVLFEDLKLLGQPKKTKTGRRLWDAFKLKLPLFGTLVRKVCLSRFAHTLSALYRAGVEIRTRARVRSLDELRKKGFETASG
jgi:hypothetical protein